MDQNELAKLCGEHANKYYNSNYRLRDFYLSGDKDLALLYCGSLYMGTLRNNTALTLDRRTNTSKTINIELGY